MDMNMCGARNLICENSQGEKDAQEDWDADRVICRSGEKKLPCGGAFSRGCC